MNPLLQKYDELYGKKEPSNMNKSPNMIMRFFMDKLLNFKCKDK